tara:strand:- start:252 stop:395 length:144 start_codon:yes stop_codon:yes gene_type:complete
MNFKGIGGAKAIKKADMELGRRSHESAHKVHDKINDSAWYLRLCTIF